MTGGKLCTPARKRQSVLFVIAKPVRTLAVAIRFPLLALFPLERQIIRDHRDEFRIGGLSLDIRHRVAEVLLQHLDVAAVPGHLDGVADFRDFRPEKVTKSDFG